MAPQHNFSSRSTQTPEPSAHWQFLNRFSEERETDIMAYELEPEMPVAPAIDPDHVLANWQVYEEAPPLPSRHFLFFSGLALIGLIGYAILTNSPIMAITFILIGLMGYLLLHQSARILDCYITTEGVVVNRELFSFENTESFWIFDEVPYTPRLSLKTGTYISPYVHIPLGDQDPETLRSILTPLVPEDKHELALVDILAHMLHI